MKFGIRLRPRIGPVRLNVTRRGVSSASLRLGPITWNPFRKRVHVNGPGGLYATHTYGRPRRRR